MQSVVSYIIEKFSKSKVLQLIERVGTIIIIHNVLPEATIRYVN